MSAAARVCLVKMARLMLLITENVTPVLSGSSCQPRPWLRENSEVASTVVILRVKMAMNKQPTLKNSLQLLELLLRDS